MRKTIAIVFLVWFCGAVSVMLLLGYHLGSPITMEMVRIIVLESFVCLNVTYLFFRLMKIDIAVAAGFAALFSLVGYAYMQIFRDMNVLTQILLMEIVLAITTIILHFVLKKRASKD